MSLSIYYPEFEDKQFMSDLLRDVMDSTSDVILLYLTDGKGKYDFEYNDLYATLQNPEQDAIWNECHQVYEGKQRVDFYQYNDGKGDEIDRTTLADFAERYTTRKRFSILKKWSLREMKTYTVIIDGKAVATYESDRMYHEFAEPFFEKFPEYKGIIKYFNHVECYAADKNLTTKPKYSINKRGEMIKHTYIKMSFGIQKQ